MAPHWSLGTALLAAALLLPACERVLPAPSPADVPPASTARAAGAPWPARADGPRGAAALASPDSVGTSDPFALAWQRGVSFRASGIEPGWYVEVLGGDVPTRLELVWDYGTNRLTSTAVTRTVAGAALVFRAADDAFSVEVRAQRAPCAEPGSGQAADYTVTVDVGAQTLRGCGRGH